MSPEQLLAKLEGVRKSGETSWMARCPAHKDSNPSLAISIGRNHDLVLFCHTGCTTESVMAALGLTIKDLFDRPRETGNGARRIAATYDYTDENGHLLFQTVRFEPKDFRQRHGDGNGGWLWNLRKREPQQHEHECSEESNRANGLSWKSGGSCVPILHPNIFSLDGTQYRGVDLLTGGFPCQPFSLAGKRRGAADDRALWPEMFRVIREAQPASILAENVPGIINMELDHCLSDLEGIGYACWPIVVPACAVDARHRRDRVWIVGHAMREGLSSKRNGQRQQDGSWKPSEDVADASSVNAWTRRSVRPKEGIEVTDCCQWEPEPNVGRVAHGVSARAHRLRALGNAIVPRVAEEIIRCMMVTGITKT